MLHLTKMVLTVFFALGMGYLVLIGASKEKGLVKSAGYLIGLVLIVASLLLLGFKAYKCAGGKMCGYKIRCHRTGPQQMIKDAGTMMPPTK